MRKLGKNLGGYLGETIDLRAVLGDLETAALQQGWSSESFLIHGGYKWLALHRAGRAGATPKRIYLSAGIHGDEPAGPLAALQLVRENRWPENAELFLAPCLNPAAFGLNKRENADGIDLNRDYLNSKSAEIRAHVAWL